MAGARKPLLEGREVQVPQEHWTHPRVVFARALLRAHDVLPLLVGRVVLALAVAVRAEIRAPTIFRHPHLLLPVTILLHDGALIFDAPEVERVVRVVVVVPAA